MKKLKFKKSVIYAFYGLAVVMLFGTIYLVGIISTPLADDDLDYVDDLELEREIPVVSEVDKLIRPYVSSNVSLARNFYDYLDTMEIQSNALIYYDGTYIPNSGVDYKSDEIFDVVAVYDGVVSKITENTLLGKIIEITHENNLITVYQSLSETSVVEGDNVLQGQAIGKSGSANISPDLGNHLHFEVILNGININPENIFDKTLEEL